jgi:large subunit ribosomal protein L31
MAHPIRRAAGVARRRPHDAVHAHRGLVQAVARAPAHATAAAILNHEMKAEIHPEYVEAHVRCTCGNEFTTRSTQAEIHVEICSNCHPFYTGKQKLVDTGGRVERFRRRQARRSK